MMGDPYLGYLWGIHLGLKRGCHIRGSPIKPYRYGCRFYGVVQYGTFSCSWGVQYTGMLSQIPMDFA
jgi:hypothetical protein